MPQQHLTTTLKHSLIDALSNGELGRAEHAATALLRTQREWIEGLLHTGHELQLATTCSSCDHNYRQRDYLATAIVSTYRAERFLRGRLTDLLQQSIADRLEIIVIDSHSPEGEAGIVAEFQQQTDTIRYLRTSRRESVYQAWNRGVALATGQFLTNANCDDRLAPTALERLCQLLQQHPNAGFAYADFLITGYENETFASHHAHDVTRRPTYHRNRLLENCITGSQPLWRRALHSRVGSFDTAYASAADYDFFIRASGCCDGIALHEPLGLVLTSPTTFSGVGQLPTLEFYAIRERYRHLLAPTEACCTLTEEEQTLLMQICSQDGKLQEIADEAAAWHSPAFAHALGLWYQESRHYELAWRYLQRAFYLAPEQTRFRRSLETCLHRNLVSVAQEFAVELPRQAGRDILLSIALTSRLLGLQATASWLYAQVLAQQPDDVVSLTNLERMLSGQQGGVA